MARQSISALAAFEKRAIPLAITSSFCLALPLFIPLTFPLPWFGLVFLLSALQSNRWQFALTGSLIFGIAFHSAANYWLIPTVADLGPYTESPSQWMSAWAVIAFVALLLWQSFFSAIFGLIAWSILSKAKGLSAAIGVGGAWILTEWLRSIGTFGYPWALLASTQVSFLPIVQWVSFVGSFGLGGAIAFVNALFFEGLRWHDKRFLLSASFLLSLIILIGWVEIVRFESFSKKSPHLTVAAVQGNFGKERWRPDVTFAELEEILQTHLRLSEQTVKGGAKLIVWSETALPWRLREDGLWSYGANEILSFAKDYQVVLLVGAGEWLNRKSYNACFVFAPPKVLLGSEVYHKIRLVPFGEYIPGKRFFHWLDKILPHAPVETEPGKNWDMPLLHFREINLKVKLAIAICFESLFPFHLRRLVASSLQAPKANLVVIITNDSWFGNTLAPYHHARVAILRAIELRRSIVRSAGTGISMIISPTGRVLRTAGWGQRKFLIASVPIVDNLSVYQILGDLPFVFFSLFFLAWINIRRK